MYKRILVPLDGSETAQRGLTEAIGIAQSSKARLVVLNVVADLRWLDEMGVANSDKMRREACSYADRLLVKAKEYAAARDVEAEIVIHETVGSRAGDAIADEARKQNCDLIVMGTHGRKGLTRLVLGSDAMLAVQSSSVPVLLVRSAQAEG